MGSPVAATVCDMRSFTQDLLRSSPDLRALTHSLVRKKYLAHTGRMSLGPNERRQLKEIVEDELLKVTVEDSDDEPLATLVHSRKVASSCLQPLPISTAMKENKSFDSDFQDRQKSVEESSDEDSGVDQKKPCPRSAPRRGSKKAANTEVASGDSACKGKIYARNGGGRDTSVEMKKGKSEVGRREVRSEDEMSEKEDSDLEGPPKVPESNSKHDRARNRVSGHNQKGRGEWRSSSSSCEENRRVNTNKNGKAATRNSSIKNRKIAANKERKTAVRNSSSSEEDRRVRPTKKGKPAMRNSSSSSSNEEDMRVSPTKKGKAAMRNNSSSSEEDRRVRPTKKGKAAMRNSSSSEEDRRVRPTKKGKAAMRNSSSSEEDMRVSPTKKGKAAMRNNSSSSEEDRRATPTKKEETVRRNSGSSSSEEDEGESPNKKGKAARQSSSSEEGRGEGAKSSSCSEDDNGESPNKNGERTSSSSSEVDQGKQVSNSSSEEDQKKSLKMEGKRERSSSSTKEKKGGGRSEAQKGHSQQGGSLDDSDSASEEEEIQKSQRGKKDTKSGPANEKNSGKDEHPSIRRLKRCILACGVRRNYKKLFEGKRSVKAKVEVLKRELEDLGVKGNPTLEKCKIVRLKREDAAELASLDTSNIISSEGRLRRRNIWNPYQTPLDTSLGENYKRSVESDSDESKDPPKKKRRMEWSNLQGIISDSGDSD
ncbi:HIRA-interacting protein 3 isoform X2 [Microcaecilia unicolor]|uniref:HIRA-interacting protein 3 isoform X2 n=1 Tax=Microcaecilia unicolor TaxID=1415580 RepID=A0A6P7YAR7_9AMPH|nr:HIRA-interacting protein 3 isoform X2 [Microcaecilia unicolor]